MDASGEISFHVESAVEETLFVTSTARNYLPYQGHALVCISSASGVHTGSGGALSFDILGNPASGPVTLRFALPRPGPVRIRVYDLPRRVVRDLPLGTQAAGPLETSWDGFGSSRQRVSSGVYFAVLEFGARRLARRMVVAR